MKKRSGKTLVEGIERNVELAYTKMLFALEEVQTSLEELPAGQTYSPKGAELLIRVDGLATANTYLYQALKVIRVVLEGYEEGKRL